MDDNRAILRLLEEMCGVVGCVTATAATAERALDLLSESQFDLVISDLNMPGRSGLDLISAMKVQQPATPVVLMTGLLSVDAVHGAYDLLPKPFSMAEIRQLLERLRVDRALGNPSTP